MTWQDTQSFMLGCLPKPVGKVLARLSEGEARELRVRSGREVRILTQSGEISCGFTPTPQQVEQMAEALCEHALYARAEEQRHGFVTLRGGHRMGLCGRVIAQGQSIRALREISSFCVRIACERRGAADKLLPHLIDAEGRARSLMILGLPGMGKTTLLRDVCRSLSDSGLRIGLVDERSELAATCGGSPQLDIGPNTDVLDACPKDIGMLWMLRSMSPDAIATDELGGISDANAVLDAARSGVSVLATMHGSDLDKAVSRGALCLLAQNVVFDRYAVLDSRKVGVIKGIYDEHMRPLAIEEEA